MGLDRTLPGALLADTDRAFDIHEDPRSWVFEDHGSARKIVETTLTLELVDP